MNILTERRRKNLKRGEKATDVVICSKCGSSLDKFRICKKCKHHERVSAKNRIEMVTDEGSFKEILSDFDIDYSARFNYSEKFQRDKKRTGLDEAVVVGTAKISNVEVLIIIMERYFMVGTLSKANGEKIARAFEYADEHSLPVVAFSAGGGVRIQEGAEGLVQMAKIDAALSRFRDGGFPYISVLTDPTYGGTTASLAMEGDINIAEPDSSIGFGGKMLAKDILHEDVPADFQNVDYVKRHGGIDVIISRRQLKNTIGTLLRCFDGKATDNYRVIGATCPDYDYSEKPPEEVLANIRGGMRPTCKDYTRKIFDDFIILSGDRISYDDPSLECGIGCIGDNRLVFITQCKGRSVEENTGLNFGMTRPEGYRKAIRLAKLAEKFHIPIMVLLDSPGAHPGNVAESNCIGIAISDTMLEFLKVKTPVISIIVGEGCSGGAISLSIADKLAMFDGATYSVISPESYSSILFDEPVVKQELLRNMHFTAQDLYDRKLIDAVLKEDDLDFNVGQIKSYFLEQMKELSQLTVDQLLDKRYNRIRNWDKNE